MNLKEKVLEALESAAGQELSGQELADKFAVSRNAVWKAVNALKRDGFKINSARSSGYTLCENSDALSANAIIKHIGENVKVYVFSLVNSTNDTAKKIMNSQHGQFIVVAEQQSAGRGRRGRSFFSPKGTGLYMSVALCDDSDIDSALAITSYAAVCVVNAVRKLTQKSAQIKWVNDVYLDGKKICGILTEAATDFETRTVKNIIVGIGVNIRQHELCDELKDIVGFVGEKEPIRNRLAAEIAKELFRYKQNKNTFMQEYKKYSLVLNKQINYYKDGCAYNAVAEDIDENGALIVVREDGIKDILSSGEITLRLAQTK